jgi:hypothetical protein
VTDTGNRRVVVFDSTGKVLCVFPPCSGMPTALAVADGKSYWSFFRHERAIFYADNGGTTLVKCSLDGKMIRKINLPAGHSASYGATDFYHNYWITDTKKHCLLKYDHDLNFLDIFGSYGTGDNQFDAPRGITIYKRYGQVFVAEKKGAQYYWIGTDCKGASIAAAGEPDVYTLTVKATEYSFTSLFEIINGDTSFYVKRHRIAPGSANLPVNGNGTNLLQRKLKMKLEPTYSSFTYNAWFFPVKGGVGEGGLKAISNKK